jgi:ribonuclease VapC
VTVVVDSSAFLAVLLKEPDEGLFRAFFAETESLRMSPVNYWEVMERARVRLGPPGVADAERLIEFLDIKIEPLTEEQARAAVVAASRYGKGHPAKLNMGDCFAYALAKTAGAALLYKGADFPHTDIASAL